MPELPEVESARRAVERLFLYKKIVDVIAKEQGHGPRHGMQDEIILADGDPSKLLINNCITGCHRKGKQLYFSIGEFGKKAGGISKLAVVGTILMHFGMSGSIIVKGEPIPVYKSVRMDSNSYPPKFTKLEIVFEEGKSLVFVDPRRLGRIRQFDSSVNPESVPPLSKLAIDAFSVAAGRNHEELVDSICTSSMPIKALLLNQEKLVSGLGNYLCDEICFQAQISPNAISKSLSRDSANHLIAVMTRVLTIAVDCTSHNKEFPASWLFHHRWSKGRPSALPNGAKIIFEKVGGRTTAIVPSIQLKRNVIEGNTKIAGTKRSNCKLGKSNLKDVGKEEEAHVFSPPKRKRKLTK